MRDTSAASRILDLDFHVERDSLKAGQAHCSWSQLPAIPSAASPGRGRTPETLGGTGTAGASALGIHMPAPKNISQTRRQPQVAPSTMS